MGFAGHPIGNIIASCVVGLVLGYLIGFRLQRPRGWPATVVIAMVWALSPFIGTDTYLLRMNDFGLVFNWLLAVMLTVILASFVVRLVQGRVPPAQKSLAQ
jgi:hypothetical protein